MEDFEHGIISAVGSAWLGTLITAVVIIVITAVVGHLLTKFLRRVLNYSDELPSSSIFVNIGRAIVWVVGGSVVLSTCFGVDVSAAIAALGIGGIAISLGFQDTISNLIGGVQVSLLRIVSPGDNISVGGAAGVVKDVNWRHTTITNSKGEMVVIPNSIINKTSLVHLPPPGKVTLSLVVEGGGEDLDERSGHIEQAALAAARRVGAVEAAPRLWFTEVVDVGFAGSLIFTMASGDDATPAKDAVLRAIAPLTRQYSDIAYEWAEGFGGGCFRDPRLFARFSGLRPLVSAWFGGLGGMQLLLLSTHKASKRLVPIAIAADRLG